MYQVMNNRLKFDRANSKAFTNRFIPYCSFSAEQLPCSEAKPTTITAAAAATTTTTNAAAAAAAATFTAAIPRAAQHATIVAAVHVATVHSVAAATNAVTPTANATTTIPSAGTPTTNASSANAAAATVTTYAVDAASSSQCHSLRAVQRRHVEQLCPENVLVVRDRVRRLQQRPGLRQQRHEPVPEYALDAAGEPTASHGEQLLGRELALPAA